MSTEMNITQAAGGQLQAALLAAARRNPSEARELLKAVKRAVRDADVLVAEGRALADFPHVPFREIRVRGYRLFFRPEKGTVWIAGFWKTAG